MRSPVERLGRTVPRALLLAVLWLGIAAAVPATAQTSDEAPTDAQIERAVAALKADPNLQTEGTIRRLRWASESQRREPSSSLRWLRDLVTWIAQSAWVLVWVVGGLLLLALVAYMMRVARHAKSTAPAANSQTPTHVRDLDIRPESLPDDIGAAVLEAWERGERRAALALLYRGLLSRLVHVHGLAIRDSSTEGECLAVAARTLEPERHRYVAQVIAVWQRATYGGREPETAELQTLCTGFARALAPPATTRSPA